MIDGEYGAMTKQNKNCPCPKDSSSGFSLIEVAIALIVIGLFITPIIMIYNISMQASILNTTKARLSNVESALNKYVIKYGHYPAPADRNIAQGLAGFGVSVAAITTNCSTPPATAGAACRTQIGAENGDGVGGPDDVLIGDIPFATLGIRYDNILDGYGKKFIYAVTQSQTVAGTFNNAWGAINVLNHDGNNLFTLPPYAHYVIASTGKDGKGAFNINGIQTTACGNPAGGVDQENCDLDALFRNNFLVNGEGAGQRLYDVAGATHFDDYLAYVTSLEAGIWTGVTNQPNIRNTNAFNIKIGAPTSTCTPAPCSVLPATRLDVTGTVKADRIKTSRFCNNTSSPACIEASSMTISSATSQVPVSPEMIGGTPSVVGILDTTTWDPSTFQYRNRVKGKGILCPTMNNTQLGMFGFNDADENCTLTAYASTIISACPSTQFAVGVLASGGLDCQ